jgi:hypothetical protein
VAQAGGTTENGNATRVRVLRLEQGQQRQLLVNLNDPAQGAGMTPVLSGDQIVVDRRRNFLREVLVPTLGIIGSIASLGLLIDRVSRNNDNTN